MRNRQRGQALPLAIAGLFCAILAFSFSLRGYQRLIERERLRARADVTAFSGGISYARGLNILAATQKAVAAGWVFLVLDGGWTKDAAQNAQRALLTGGPWLSLGMLENVALENGLVGVAIWNKDAVLEDFSMEDLRPSYNVHPFTVGNAIVAEWKKLFTPLTDAGLINVETEKKLREEARERLRGLSEETAATLKKSFPDRDPEGLFEPSHYEYKRQDGTVVSIPTEEAGPVLENGPGGKKVKRNKAKAKHHYRYVREIPGMSPDFQLSLEDGDPHMLTLFGIPLGQSLGKGMGLAQVQVAGGSQSMVDLNGSAYNATFVPVHVFPDNGWTLETRLNLKLPAGTDIKYSSVKGAKIKETFGVDPTLSDIQGALEGLPLSTSLRQRAMSALATARELRQVQH